MALAQEWHVYLEKNATPLDSVASRSTHAHALCYAARRLQTAASRDMHRCASDCILWASDPLGAVHAFVVRVCGQCCSMACVHKTYACLRRLWHPEVCKYGKGMCVCPEAQPRNHDQYTGFVDPACGKGGDAPESLHATRVMLQ